MSRRSDAALRMSESSTAATQVRQVPFAGAGATIGGTNPSRELLAAAKPSPAMIAYANANSPNSAISMSSSARMISARLADTGDPLRRALRSRVGERTFTQLRTNENHLETHHTES